MVTTFETRQTRTADVVRLAVGRTARRLRQQAGDELTPSQSAILASISRHGPVTPSRLAQIERISRPTVTRLVAKLKAEGLIECTQDPDDGRSYQLTVSANGSVLRKMRRRRKHAYLAQLLENADSRELDGLEQSAKLLLRLIEEERT